MLRSFTSRAIAGGLLVLTTGCVAGQQPSSIGLKELRAGFNAPPPEARLRCYWWWLNGNTDKATITHDLEEMKAKGFGGALLVDAGGANQEGNHSVPAGPMFGSPAWTELYVHALREADRLGLEITLNVMSGWNLGGPTVTPEQSSKVMTWTRTAVHGGTAVTVSLPAPEAKNGFYRQIAVLAYPLHGGASLQPLPGLRSRSAGEEAGFSVPVTDWMLDPNGRPTGARGPARPSAGDSSGTPQDAALAEVRELSTNTSADGKLTWMPPPGDWEVLRIGYTDSDAQISTSSDTWKGRALDTMSREAFDAYWDLNVKPLLVAAKPFHSLKYLAEDSWELGGTNWTEGFGAEFRKRRGYDPTPWLPVIAGRVVESPDASTRFLTDLRRTVGDLIEANHYGRFAERAAEFGLGVQAESGGPHGAPVDALQTFAHAAVPQTEFWSINPHRSTDFSRFFVKEAASASNIYGRRFVAAEGETSINRQWDESLASDLKPSFDMAVTEGMNRLVWHAFTSNPASTGLPGQQYFAGTHLDPKVTWWNAGTAFFTYLNRVQFMMQQGAQVNDVLYFYGDNVPNFVRLKADDPAHVMPGYDYDVVNEDALLHQLSPLTGHAADMHTLTSSSGARWSVLVMPQSGRVSLAALERIGELVRSGIVVVGLRPSSPTGQVTPAQSARFDSLATAIWGDACDAGKPRSYGSYGRGQVFCTTDTRAAMAKIGRVQQAIGIMADVSLSGTDTAKLGAAFDSTLDYAHRRAGTTDIYFVRNGSAQPVHQKMMFRASGTAELWDAVNGTMQTAAQVTSLPNGTSLTLDLPPFGSKFVVFTREQASLPKALTQQRSEPLQASKPWQVSFQSGRGAPAETLSVQDLKSWTEWPQPGVRYFSGTALYRTTVSAPTFAAGEQVLLQFSDVREIARVKINGHDAGTVWAQPLTLRVDPWLKPGDNTLEIEVTNLWPNRIIGDLQPGATEHITSTNIATYKAGSPLLPSGLIGPLSWRIEH